MDVQRAYYMQWWSPIQVLTFYDIQYLYHISNRPIVIMPTHPKVTQVPRVVHDDLDVLDRPQATYPESFMSTSLVLAEI